LDSPKTKAAGRAFDLFVETRSFRSASISSISSSSVLISPSSWFPNPTGVGEVLSSAGWEVPGCNQFFGRHRSGSTFSLSHLFGGNISKK
jgi:hypothetical protein